MIALRRAARAGFAMAVVWLVPAQAPAQAQAQAQDHPPFAPTRDAAITYRITSVSGGGADMPRELRIAVQAASGLTRFELPGKGYAVLDRRANRIVVVMEAQHGWMEMPPGATGGARRFMLDASMQFTRTGQDRVAGQGCTVWQVRGAEGSGTLCMTDAGVLLRGAGTSKDGRMQGGIEAISVSYAPQPASLFAPPESYHQMDIAALMQSLQGHPSAP